MFSRHVFDDLSAYAEQQLEARAVTRVETHLQGCARCRAALEDIRRGIAFAEELEPQPMPLHVAASIRARLDAANAVVGSVALVERPSESPSSLRAYIPLQESARRAWHAAPLLRIAAAIVLCAAAAAGYWQINRPWAHIREGETVPTAFERESLRLHEALKRGEARIDFASTREHALWEWLAEQHAPVTSAVAHRDAASRRRFVPVGAAVRAVAGARASVLAFRIDDKPVTLMLATERDVPDAPASGMWSKIVTHRQDERGVNTLTWSVGRETYALVSELEGFGQDACFLCHTDERFQKRIKSRFPRDVSAWR